MIDIPCTSNPYKRFEISAIDLGRGDQGPADSLSKILAGNDLRTILRTGYDNTPIF